MEELKKHPKYEKLKKIAMENRQRRERERLKRVTNSSLNTDYFFDALSD